MRKKFWIILLLIVGLLPSVAMPQTTAVRDVEPRFGLMWQNTGLPAVFPLQIKTQGGRNYYLQLRHADTGEAALAAFIEGGKYFKVLVPPGRFTVRVSSGRAWQGEEMLFGSGALTHIIELPAPLTFAARDFSTKAGHLIDLTQVGSGQMTEVSVKAQFICQSYGIAPVPPRSAIFGQYHDIGLTPFTELGNRGHRLRYHPQHLFGTTTSAFGHQAYRNKRGLSASHYWLRPDRPKFRVRWRFC